MRAGRKIGIIAAVDATLRDSEYYLHRAAEEQGRDIETELCFAEELIPLYRTKGEEAFNLRLEELVADLGERVDVVLLGQFSMSTALARLQAVCPGARSVRPPQQRQQAEGTAFGSRLARTGRLTADSSTVGAQSVLNAFDIPAFAGTTGPSQERQDR